MSKLRTLKLKGIHEGKSSLRDFKFLGLCQQSTPEGLQRWQDDYNINTCFLTNMVKPNQVNLCFLFSDLSHSVRKYTLSWHTAISWNIFKLLFGNCHQSLLSILFRVFSVNSCFFLKVDLNNRKGQKSHP